MGVNRKAENSRSEIIWLPKHAEFEVTLGRDGVDDQMEADGRARRGI